MEDKVNNATKDYEGLKHEVLDNIRIKDVAEFCGLDLIPRGEDFICLCPWHQDTTPSLSISTKKQIYKCFACGEGGNAIKMVKELKHTNTTLEAIMLIIDEFKLNINIEDYGFENYSTKVQEKNNNFSSSKEALEFLIMIFNMYGYHKSDHYYYQDLLKLNTSDENMKKVNTLVNSAIKHVDESIREEFENKLNLYIEKLKNYAIFPIINKDGRIINFELYGLDDKRNLVFKGLYYNNNIYNYNYPLICSCISQDYNDLKKYQMNNKEHLNEEIYITINRLDLIKYRQFNNINDNRLFSISLTPNDVIQKFELGNISDNFVLLIDESQIDEYMNAIINLKTASPIKILVTKNYQVVDNNIIDKSTFAYNNIIQKYNNSKFDINKATSYLTDIKNVSTVERLLRKISEDLGIKLDILVKAYNKKADNKLIVDDIINKNNDIVYLGDEILAYLIHNPLIFYKDKDVFNNYFGSKLNCNIARIYLEENMWDSNKTNNEANNFYARLNDSEKNQYKKLLNIVSIKNENDYKEKAKQLLQDYHTRILKDENQEYKITYENTYNKFNEVYNNILLNDIYGKEALEYLQNRNISLSTIYKYQIGVSPKFIDAFQNVKINLENIIDENSSLNMDEKEQLLREAKFFGGRIIFPIMNERGQTVGYSGRLFNEEKSEFRPKYKNSAESVDFQKKELLFNLCFSQDYIKQLDEVYVVEGYMDAIKMDQYGVKNVVAAMGTAFTKENAERITSLATNVKLMFDGDEAGINAAKKSLEVLSTINCDKNNIKIIILPNKMDPDEYLDKYGIYNFYKMVKHNEKSIEEFLIFDKTRNIEPESYIELDKALPECFDIVEESNEQLELLSNMSDYLSVSSKSLKKDFINHVKNKRTKSDKEL